ncbi:hypothetical protein LOTGIDRAFT_212149 [Lottia gigantea]|uniref:Mitochondrial thiamine pyrophosphate carrier n=1 Tax=Lottia gigantea TaxID=225164 RepID=V4AIP1_LOTGI|nr:hypothetical protein LOTGIDRAFT_212149 [Lottia gigantea]ESP03969.1 hypothetical protein LOTGIDRAFT_212149 [Lottia gigantea]
MIGYDPTAKIHLSRTEFMLAGGISGAVCRLLYQPFDVLKIRFQLQVEPIEKSSQGSKYRSLTQAFRVIVKEEGFKALWKGHVPAQILSIGYGGVQFASYEVLTQVLWKLISEDNYNKYKFTTHTLCGFEAGCLATIFIHPVDVLRTRLIAQGEPKVYNGIVDASFKIMKHEGFKGFYKGVVPALCQVGPQMGLQFGFYAVLTQMVEGLVETRNSFQGVSSFLCGAASGIAAKSLIFPLDVVKKRMQIVGFEEARHSFGAVRNYTLLRHCFRAILLEEGIRGLYKGLVPGVIKAGLVAGTNFCIYGSLCDLLLSRHR